MLFLPLSGQTSSVSNATTSKMSVSVEKSNEKFLFTSYFDSLKTVEAKASIITNLGRPKEDNSRMTLWEEKGINVIVRRGKVRIEMYYESANRTMIPKVEKLADEISKIIK
ncbi:hypothetical protein [Chryseobacterium sp. 18068]|uniref:hypothetical protein n=1 Tax=Chryseobacterium sp. 18068 TaxID=2681414 RepID=UPI001357F1FA|nr:hypothetical protein [Chryseobacterium sp. 18068]